MHRDKNNIGFTLIELLVIVGIIAILASISLSNYQDALTRAKVARVASEFRTIRTALETYTADTNTLPRMAHHGFYSDPYFDAIDGIAVNGVLSKCISTPVAYLTKSIFPDPFMAEVKNSPLDEQLYTYQVISVYEKQIPQSTFWPKARAFYGDWRLASVGPDLHFNHNFLNSGQLPYDASNGTLSLGNIIDSPKAPIGTMPPIPDLLGPG